MFNEREKLLTIAETLDPRESALVAESVKRASVVICDIDYTLLDVSDGHEMGVHRLARATTQQIAYRVDDLFNLVVEGHRRPVSEVWDRREEFETVLSKMSEVQGNIVPEWGLKVWSIETWIQIAADEQNKRVTPSDIIAGRDAYWSGRKDGSVAYEDALALNALLVDLKKPLYLMTGSYSILKVGNHGTLSYDPDYSQNYKRGSLKDLPFVHKAMFIGDPIDKPELSFFDKVFSSIEAMEPNVYENPLVHYLVIGDSQRNDLEVPRDLGTQTILIKRK